MIYFYDKDLNEVQRSTEMPEGSQFRVPTRAEVLKFYPAIDAENGIWPAGVYNDAGKLIAPVPYEFMTAQERDVCDSCVVKYGKNKGKTLKEVRELSL
jgi:hypothetical protein